MGVKLRDWLGIEQAPVSHIERAAALTGGFIGILVTYWIGHAILPGPAAALLVASMGASAVLVFAVPHGPLSQPWPVLGGHLVSVLIGIFCARWIPNDALAAAAAVGLAIGAMHYLRCLHPPGGASALVAVIGGAEVHALGFQFALTPVMINAVVLVLMAVAFNALFAWRRYPAAWRPRQKPKDPYPDISHAAFVAALADLDTFIDVTEEDLLEIYKRVTAAERAV